MIQRAEAVLLKFTLFIATGVDAIKNRAAGEDRDRGDVPGWVMITLMTAIVVIGLLAVFRDQVFDAVSAAFSSIS